MKIRFSYRYLDFEVFFFFFFVSLQCNRVSLAYASDAKEKKGSYVPFLFPIVYLFLN